VPKMSMFTERDDNHRVLLDIRNLLLVIADAVTAGHPADKVAARAKFHILANQRAEELNNSAPSRSN